MTIKRRTYFCLKQLRVWLAVVFFVATAMVFLDLRHEIPPPVVRAIVLLQIIPSLLKGFTGGVAALLIFGILVSLTMLFGRIYCSTVCPLGVIQDGFLRLYGRLRKKKRFSYNRTPPLFQYGLLAIALVLVWGAGSAILLNLFEPYSNAGRIFVSLCLPVVKLCNNILASGPNWSNSNFLYNVPIPAPAISALLWSIGFTVCLTALTIWRGRVFCNMLCPAGGLLRLVSKFAWYRVTIDKESCNGCGACEKLCKAQCIQSEAKRVDHQACIGCFNCIAACPSASVKYTRTFPVPLRKTKEIASVRYNSSRRIILTSIFTPALLLPAALDSVGNALSIANGKNGRKSTEPISPPGSLGTKRFSELCTACHLCIASCPSNVLAPAFLEYGITGVLQPRMEYTAGYCRYECTTCGTVCPSGAILPLETDAKKEIQIGRAKFIRDDCIVVSKKKDCGACSEHCPTKAVRMVPYEGKLAIPDLNNDLCVGCGACEHSCPIIPQKAIFVESNSVHRKAQKPSSQLQQQAPPAFDPSQAFPF